MDEAMFRYTTAKGYVQSIFMIHTHEHRAHIPQTMPILAMGLLAGFALELYFKAYLLGSGRTSEEVRRFGHRVADLYKACTTSGLQRSEPLDSLVSVFATGHEDFTFRYSEEGQIPFPHDWGTALDLFKLLDSTVDARVGASARFGLTPGR